MIVYSRPNQVWTFFEIDPAVISIAQDSRCFDYLDSCARAPWRIVEGDARLRLAACPENSFDFIAIDAFSSDAIPIHLITREAIEMYLDKLAPEGLLAFHISNRYVDLEPVLGDLAHTLGLTARNYDDWNWSATPETEGKELSQWVVLARREADLAGLYRLVRWVPLARREVPRPWTDDRADLMSVFRWE
jgi:spermidine synthase